MSAAETDKMIDKLQRMRRLESCFAVGGVIDLLEMSNRVPEEVFRKYCEYARERRQRKNT